MGYVNNWKYFLQSDLGINLGNYEEAMVQDTGAQGTGAQLEREPDGRSQLLNFQLKLSNLFLQMSLNAISDGSK